MPKFTPIYISCAVTYANLFGVSLLMQNNARPNSRLTEYSPHQHLREQSQRKAKHSTHESLGV